jgi:hypothetical protein
MSMNNSLTLFSDDDDEDDDFLLNLVQSLPEIRVYADRPNLFAKYSNAQIKERFRLDKDTILRLAEIFEPYIGPKTDRSKSYKTVDILLMALR